MFEHPKKVCLTYYSHMKFSMFLSLEFAKASFFAFVHGIYPDAYVTHSSDTIKNLQNEMEKIGCRKIDLEKNKEE